MGAWSIAWALAAVLACWRLLRASGHPEPSVRNGYRWFAVAAVCLAAGAIIGRQFGGLIGGAPPLRIADLISLAALPALLIGLATLTARYAPADHGGPRLSRLLREHGRSSPGGVAAGIALDSLLLIGSLFLILQVALFGPDFVHGNAGRAAFALALLRPLADLAALGLALHFVVRSLRLTLPVLAALTAVTIGDALAVADRTTGHVASLGPRLTLLIGLLLLAAAPTVTVGLTALAAKPVSRLVRPGSTWSSPATVAALAASAAAALVLTGFAIAARPLTTRPLALAGALVVLLLVVRLAGLTRQATAVAEAAEESDWMFAALAATTSDAVLVCERSGIVQYASRAVAEFGYEPGELTGRLMTDIVHPEDQPAGIRAAVTGLRSAAGVGTFTGRVRGADGSWRHVEATLSRYGLAGEPARLLITSRDVSDRVALRRQLTQLTFHDGLTGLPNRVYVEDRVKELARQASTGAAGAILVDFDGYTAVNDLAGHAGGDLVLAQAARRLRAAVPPSGTVGRWGGDEFVVLLPAAAASEDVMDLAERLAGVIAAEPFPAAGKELSVTASVGVAVAPASQADQVLGQAELALAKAQEAGLGRVEIYAAAMQAQAGRRAELAEDLRRAIGEQRLDIEYQPVIEFASGSVRAVEAMVRWPGDGEEIPADDFLSVAEETGLTVALGDWTRKQACRQVAAWRAAGIDVGLATACTARQASAPGFVPSVLAALEDAGLPPEALTIKVSDQLLTAGPPAVVAELAVLRGKGIKLELGSSGAGLISLASMRGSAIDAVTIDSACVTGMEADPTLPVIVKAIIGLARDLGIEVVASGIQRPEERAVLEALGCGLGQGPGLAGMVSTCELELTSSSQAGDTACSTAG
jgi:diguanylate cyclase (GGDEF)-like protein/PAS domain S-box-containing protein